MGNMENSILPFKWSLRHTLSACEVVLSLSLRSPLIDTKPKVRGGDVHISVEVAWWTGGPLTDLLPHQLPLAHTPHYAHLISWYCALVSSEEGQGPCSECWAHFLVSYLMSILPSYHRYPPGRIPNEYKIGSLMPHPSKSELETHTLQRWTLETSITFLGTGYRLQGKH